MGKESEDHMRTVSVEDYIGKGPKLVRIMGAVEYILKVKPDLLVT